MTTTESFRQRYGQWAVVAGASEGLGASFARQIAMRGIHLILLARRADALKTLADDLHQTYSVQVEPLALDLASDTLAADLAPQLRDREIGLAVYNAAVSVISPFNKMSLADKQRHIRVNCDGPMILASLVGEAMTTRKRGGIILMTSAAGLVGTELLTMYSATKAYNIRLAEGLWQEYRASGVDVLGVIAGAVATPNYDRSQATPGRFNPPPQDPDDLARAALDHLGRGYPLWHSTPQISFADFLLTRLLPRTLAIRFFSSTTRSMYNHFRQ